MISFIVVLSLFVELAFCILCGANMCNIAVINCSAGNSFCVQSGDPGVFIVPNSTAALNMCQSLSTAMTLVAPADNETNAAMFVLCPSAAFFDIVATSGTPCNSFVISSTGQSISYANWRTGEPNNHMQQQTPGCSPGPSLVENCVAFSVRTAYFEFQIVPDKFFLSQPVAPKDQWIDRQCDQPAPSVNITLAGMYGWAMHRCVICGSLKAQTTTQVENSNTTATTATTTTSTTTTSTTNATSTLTTLISSNATTSVASAALTDQQSSTGALIGGIVGGVIGAFLLTILIVILLKRRGRREAPAQAASPQQNIQKSRNDDIYGDVQDVRQQFE